MFLFKQLDFSDWYTITADNCYDWIEKLSKLTKKQMSVHKVFHPAELEKELIWIKQHQHSLSKGNFDKMRERRYKFKV